MTDAQLIAEISGTHAAEATLRISAIFSIIGHVVCNCRQHGFNLSDDHRRRRRTKYPKLIRVTLEVETCLVDK